jgi:hypothetical protein
MIVLPPVGTHEYVYYKWQECVVVARVIPVTLMVPAHVIHIKHSFSVEEKILGILGEHPRIIKYRHS